MPRKPPMEKPELMLDPANPPVTQRRKNNHGEEPVVDMITQVREYELITPLMGGGVEAGYVDLELPVNAKAIRGHLRFWWRATRGGQYPTIAKLRESEINLWGGASTPKANQDSLVQLQVGVTNKGNKFVNLPDREGNSAPLWHPSKSDYGYLAFPLKDKKSDAQVLEKVSFTLAVTHPKSVAAEINAALWAWETFGGIGARTRRGFGAPHLKSMKVGGQVVVMPALNDARKHIENGLKDHLVQNGKWPDGVPHLSSDSAAYVVIDGFDEPLAAWRCLIKELKRFRQDRFPQDSGGKFGRSKWPEPDAIRHDTRHSQRHRPNPAVPRKFPRAEFGLPIIFQFKEDDVRDKDPETTTLEGAKHNRLASRVILRPLKLANGRAVALATVLEAPAAPPGGLVLKTLKGEFKDGTTAKPVSSLLTVSEAARIQPLNSNPNVIGAFLRRLIGGRQTQ